jgi:DNA modification methylase
VKIAFQNENVTLWHGDCREWSGKADAVISDPPYGMNHDTNTSRFTSERHSCTNGKRNAGRHDGYSIANDDQPFDPAPWLDFPAVVMWGVNHFTARVPAEARRSRSLQPDVGTDKLKGE